MKKTVCFVSTHYFPILGGITRYTYNLIKELQAKNVEVIMITLNVADLPEYEVTEGVEIFRLPCFKFMAGRFPVIRLNKQCRNTLKELAKRKIDLMSINARFYVLSLFMAWFGKKNKIPTMIIDHGSSHLTMGSLLMTKMGEWYEHIITMFLKVYCKDFYGVSKASCEWLKHFGIQAKGTLYNAVDLKYIESVLEHPVKDYKKEYNLPEDAVIVAFTGRFVIEKGILQLIEAVENLRKKYPQVYLLVAGDGPLKQQIVDSISEGVILLGEIKLEEIVSLLKQSTILCLPSASEGFPTSVLEAVACKCFVAATKVGGAAEIIPTKEYGILLEKNDSAHIEEAVEYALKNKDAIKKATDASYTRMLQNFTWAKTGEKVYRILMQERR